MNSDIFFRLTLAILFVLVIGVRRYYENKAAKIPKEDFFRDRDSGKQIAL